ncbi:MAG: nucleotidyltransferase family protein [Prevotella sp.]|jgi:D-glycero-alpha-D-manno-heptose 1-phosphate guanylyltransferase|nr:nucleotidyltransferase family protein [Prevotella sp.]
MSECIVLAGGFGSRLQQVVKDVPKCLAEVAGKPFLAYLFDYLAKQAVSRVILSLGYKSEAVINWIDKNSFPFETDYVVESTPLGTGGGIKLAMSKALEKTVFVINGDTFFEVNLQAMQEAHRKKKADISIALKPMRDFDRYGSVKLDADNRITDFIEKKHCALGLINGGVYLIERQLLNNMRLGEKFSFEKDVLENKSSGIHLFGCIDDGYFIDIGIPSDFEQANRDFKHRQANEHGK